MASDQTMSLFHKPGSLCMCYQRCVFICFSVLGFRDGLSSCCFSAPGKEGQGGLAEDSPRGETIVYVYFLFGFS